MSEDDKRNADETADQTTPPAEQDVSTVDRGDSGKSEGGMSAMQPKLLDLKKRGTEQR